MEKLVDLSHLFITVFFSSFSSFMVIPAITDVTMFALCPGKDECSLAIYLTGFQQAVIGIGTVVLMPIMGSMSDHYGRKALLTIPMTLSIIPLVILAYSRSTESFYAYYVLKTLTAMVSEGTVNCLALAYVADNISERQRASGFGMLAGVGSAAFVCGTLATRLLSTTALTFQVATIMSMIAIVYMRVFLKESIPNGDDLKQPILSGGPSKIPHHDDSPNPSPIFKKIPSIGDMICLLKSSKKFSQAASVSFFNSLADGGLQASMLYFLKARFHFNKNQFADLMLIAGVGMTISQLLVMPLLLPLIGEEKLLSVGLLLSCVNMFLTSVSWSVWVPYATTILTIFIVFVIPCLRSIVSKQVGSTEQGKAQGCISGVSSMANIISPLLFSPLTALFLSERAPFDFPGFSIMCIGFATMLAFIQSTMIKATPPTPNHKINNKNDVEV